MKAEKAYILYIENHYSKEYRDTAIESCEKVGIPYECVLGYSVSNSDSIIKFNEELKIINSDGNLTLDQLNLWASLSKEIKNLTKPIVNKHWMDVRAACATAGHYLIWDKIIEDDVVGIVLEHDAIMLHKPEIDIPDDAIVALGYKRNDPENYHHEIAGPPQKVVPADRHSGAHAYAITPKTAKRLLKELDDQGITEAVDNRYFMREKLRFAGQPDKITSVNLGITDPICALGWLRRSTIWGASANFNYELIDSYTQHSSKI